MDTSALTAAVLDMDGVVTRTARIHARAWKQMFDDFLDRYNQQRGSSHTPFTVDQDYRQYVDGKPRYDGVRSFLESRGIELPEGKPSDTAAAETICGLGNRKNQIFLDLLHEGNVEVYEDTVAQIEAWKSAGWKVGVISSSRNCEAVLQAAGVRDLFDAKVDGNDMEQLEIPGKPAPHIFLQAAEQLGATPSQTVLVEDAVAGVEAGRAGKFGLVVGVVRNQHDVQLRRAGADRVVRDLRELRNTISPEAAASTKSQPRFALHNPRQLTDLLRGRQLALFLDYDGTLTPIVRRPEEATLSTEMRSLLRALSQHCTLAIVSGRDLPDVQSMVQLDALIYAGSHGFDIRGPNGLRMQQPEALEALPELDSAEDSLQAQLDAIPGVRVERKRFAIAVHFREVANEQHVRQISAAVDTEVERHSGLRKKGGKKIFELQPDVPWHKGRAILWLTESLQLDLDRATVVYVGDDETDEDAFRVLRNSDWGLGVRVGLSDDNSSASHYVHDCQEVSQLLELILNTVRE